MNGRVSSFDPPSRNCASYAQRLLDDMASGRTLPDFCETDPALAWALSGAMWLTGTAEGAPRLAPNGIPRAVDGAFRALRALAGPGDLAAIDPTALLSERARHFGGHRRGRVSVGGSCRLLRASDGWIAINLARPDDGVLLGAWFEDDTAPKQRSNAGGPDGGPAIDAESWRYLRRRVAERTTRGLLQRARLLGLPVAAAKRRSRASEPLRGWRAVTTTGRRVARGRRDAPRVLDLSALWAGPLCAHLLAVGGADVIKVESWQRPDGARAGAPGFYDLLNAGKTSVALELRSEVGRARLRQLISSTDIVIESARPRALAQFGIDAAACVLAQPGLSWVSITGYGRREPEANWVAFGDDAGVAGGLSTAIADRDGPLFCADAIADPLTGLHAAVAALGSYRAGGGELIDLNLCDVSAFALAAGPEFSPGARVEAGPNGSHELALGSERHAISEPRTRPARGRAQALGAGNAQVFERLNRVC